MFLVTMSPSVTLAQSPLVVEGVEKYHEADLEGAVESFARAEAADDLSESDLATLYATRALIHRALGDTSAVEADLGRLAVVAPGHRFDESAPPDVVESFDRMRAQGGNVEVQAEAEATPTGTRLTGRAVRDPADMVREVRVHARTDGEWQTAPNVVEITGNTMVSYYAEAHGPGGVVLGRHGSRESPLEHGGGSFPWLWVGIGAGAVVLAAVIIAIAVAAGGTDEVQPTLPMPAGGM